MLNFLQKEAKALMLYVQNNEQFKEFAIAIKSKGHASALEYLKKFDLSQIKTGYETPREFA